MQVQTVRYVSSLVSTVQDLPVLGDISTVCTLECALLTHTVDCRTPERKVIYVDCRTLGLGRTLSQGDFTLIQGDFFNWASLEFAKCWPVSIQYKKNDRVPDWPPLIIEKSLSA